MSKSYLQTDVQPKTIVRNLTKERKERNIFYKNAFRIWIKDNKKKDKNYFRY